MQAIPYSVTSLRKCVQYRDIQKNSRLIKKDEREKTAREAIKNIEAGTIFHNPIKETVIRNKPAFQFIDIKKELTSRLVDKNLRTAYNIKQNDRNNIIATLLSFLYDGTPYHIYRFDIKNFYESVDRKILLDNINIDGSCTPQTINLLEKIFLSFDYHQISGLPRGLGISSTLSEIYMKELDLNIKKRNDVFYYSRFVDDIAVITSGLSSRKEIEKYIHDLLPIGIELHETGKRTFLSLPKLQEKVKAVKVNRFTYLGYQFGVHNTYSSKVGHWRKKRNITIDISQDKIEKIKFRLASSFCSYLASKRGKDDYLLLKNRIRSLTGNYTIKDPITGIKIKTGIYFNYRHANISSRSSLKNLDNFLLKILFSKKNKLAKRIANAIPLEDRRKIAGYTFSSGFEKIRYHSFSFKTLSEIKKDWKK